MIDLQNLDKSIYLVFGEEEFLKNRIQKDFIDVVVPKGMEMMNLDIFEDKNTNVSNIIDAVTTMPFMSEKRLVIVKNSGLFVEGRKNDTEAMLNYLKDIPDTSVFLFIEKKVDKRQKLFKSILKDGIVDELKQLSNNELISWVLSIFKDNKVRISKDSVTYLIRVTSLDMEMLTNEIDKLVSFSMDSGIVTNDDIDLICTKSVESKIFDLVGAMGNKNMPVALSKYRNLIINRESPFYVLSMIVRQFRIILQVKYLNAKRYDISQITKELSLRDFMVREALHQSKQFKNKELLQAINDCLQTDKNIKTGLMSDELAVELLIIKYASK